MKNIIKFSTVIFFLMMPLCFVFSQTIKIKVYQIWINKTNHKKIKGYLYSVDTKGIKVTSNISRDATNLKFVKPEDIKSIRLRKHGKGRVLRSGIIGGVAGAGIGVLIGMEDGKQSEGIQVLDDGVVTLFTGVLFSGLGTGVGILISKAKRKFIIDGNVNIYYKHLIELDGLAIIKHDELM